MDNQTRVLDYALQFFPNAALMSDESKLAFNDTGTTPTGEADEVLAYAQQFFPNTHFYGNDSAPLGIVFAA